MVALRAPLRLFARRNGSASAPLPVLRADVLGVERLQEYARALAQEDQIDPRPRNSRDLFRRLADNRVLLTVAQKRFSLLARANKPLSPAAEWLLDNFYVVSEQLRQIEQDLSQGYYAELPKLADGKYAGYPRVYGIALELIAHTDSRLDVDGITGFVQSYQSVSLLSSGELWAVAIMLRLGLVENLRRLVEQSLATLEKRESAEAWAERFLRVSGRSASNSLVAVSELARDHPQLDDVFLVALMQRLRDEDPSVVPVIHYLEQRAHDGGTSVDDIVRAEHLRRASNRVSVGNVITSMRLLSIVDWQAFFEACSAIERTLRDDPAGVYAGMDFATRDQYRHEVERIAKRSSMAIPASQHFARAEREQAVSAEAVRLAHDWRTAQPAATVDGREAHVGYYLIGRGLPRLETTLSYRPSARERAARWVLSHATLFYLSGVALLTLLFLLGAFWYALTLDPPSGILALILALVLIPNMDNALTVLNWIVTTAAAPRRLPKLEFKAQVPEACRSMVVVPALLGDVASVERLFDGLEVRYLANRDPHLHFALLGDFADAYEQHRPEDGELTAAAKRLLAQLNERYGDGAAGPFYFFQRQRTWNEAEQAWMGWERKRGKLIEFNRLLRGAQDTNYVICSGDLSILPRVKFVITLDADTELPINAARRLIGTLAHPLNRPVVDERTGRVVEGYGIVQPRTAVTAVAAALSRFTQIYAGDTGLDPYSTAASDVYQDLFGAGIYVGKAIYDVNVVERVLGNRFPPNTLLSHDLLEGAYARAGLATDIQLLEDFPTGVDAYMQRQHRWIRGDWQITDWLLPSVHAPAAEGGESRGGHATVRVPNPLPLIERWKIFDNLRRSLAPPSIVALLVASWTVLPGSPFVWSAVALFPIIFPQLVGFASGVSVHPSGETWVAYLMAVRSEALLSAWRALLNIALVLYSAVLNLDAIARVIVRRLISHRHLLEWTSAALAEHGQARTIADYWRRMWSVPLVSSVLLLLVFWLRPAALLGAWPVLTLWWFSPLIAFYVSQPLASFATELPAEARRELRLLARKIWRFYDTFAGAYDHYLPPDNYQEDPIPVVAHRTSPTNIGFLLLSTLAAYDFGHVTLSELVDRVEHTFDTLDQMETYRGHLYNWYDTNSLHPLLPRYVSTVDSGNFAASLYVLKQACYETADAPVVVPALLEGLLDTIGALHEALEDLKVHAPSLAAACDQIDAASRAGLQYLSAVPKGAREWLDLLASMDQCCTNIGAAREKLEQQTDRTTIATVNYWCESLAHAVQSQRAVLLALMPWVAPSDERKSLGAGLNLSASAELVARHSSLEAAFDRIPALRDLAAGCAVSEEMAALEKAVDAAPLYDDERARWRGWLRTMRSQLEQAQGEAAALIERYHALAKRADGLAAQMDFTFLFDEEREVFSVGLNPANQGLDNSYYDLLASEARLASFVAIAQGQVPARHWFKLSRPMTHATGRLALLSWGGTMFEYLMPPLLMRAYEHTLLDESVQAVVRRQIQYGEEHHVPWGISESGFYAFDYQQNYQYRLFGVPDLGLRRELGQDLVIAPYATLLALPVAPLEAWRNLQRLKAEGAADGYGFYEALDYTPTRRPKNLRAGVVRSFMAHHQGMSLVALDNRLNDHVMRRRFSAEPLMAAAELLLQEKLPRHAPIIQPHPEEGAIERLRTREGRELETGTAARPFTTAHTRTPRTHLLSNGNYTVMLTNAGSGYSTFNDTALTRWREDVTRDDWGTFIYITDVERNLCWSAAYQPVGLEPNSYEVRYLPDRAEFRRRDGSIETRMSIVVSPEDNVEVRRLTLHNAGSRPRELQITSYAEVVLDRQAADAAHPAFSKLFVESEFLQARSALLFNRRPRAFDQLSPWAIHLLNAGVEPPTGLEFETDRARFIGRGRTVRDAGALSAVLSNTAGATLDPIMSLRSTVRLAAGAQLTLSFVTGFAESREQVQSLADHYADVRSIERVFDLAAPHSDVRLRHLGITGDEAHLFQRLASRILYPDPALRATSEILERNRKGQSGLWAYGISGDYPLVLVKIDDVGELSLVRQALLAHQFWQMHNFNVDLVILNERTTSYKDAVQDAIQSMIDTSLSRPWVDKPGGVFVRRGDLMPEDDKVLLQTVARVILDGELGSLADQLERSPRLAPGDMLPASRDGARKVRDTRQKTATQPPSSDSTRLAFSHGLGGFDVDAREYVIRLGAAQWTPVPWINVIANEQFGCLVSDSGPGNTWSLNSQQNRLTPWGNDPVSDRPGEVLYLADVATGARWSPTPLPLREDEPYEIRHGAGYTRFTHRSHGIAQELLVFVPRTDPLKLMRLKLRNESDEARTLNITYYVEWALGVQRELSQHFIVTDYDAETGVLFARNAYNADFAERIAFVAASETPSGATADRTEFIGRNGALDFPAALERGLLAGHFGTTIDPCAVLQVTVDLPPRAAREVIFMLGEADDRDTARMLIRKYRDPVQVRMALDDVARFWADTLTAVQVQTPDESMNVMLNQWLLYQVLSCRVWGRSALYQSSGAYGYRDQLQDVLALLWSVPRLAREHIVRAAAHQFVEGDAQHWWHPPKGAGVRAEFSDDYLWLPFVTHLYVSTTGDTQLLDEQVEFIKAPALEPGQHELYGQPQPSGEKASLYEHCTRAIERALTRFGQHGLPLMGIGDWNDGMNRVGSGGKGESVWVGWFLYDILTKFAVLAGARGQADTAGRYNERADALKRALDEQAWDGAWYRRAYFDDGTPLGSQQNDECRIDSIAQTWAVITAAGEPSKQATALQSLAALLIDERDNLVHLLTPPFDRGRLDPGYIKGYPPGIRENGAQYTHAATWVALAYALRGDGRQATHIWHMLNPVNHALTSDAVARYKVEPYVVVADVYSHPQHVGRGGWTWYTGSASWLYRVGLEHILGLTQRGTRLTLDPCIPTEWEQYQITYRFGASTYQITVENPAHVSRGVARTEQDGQPVEAIQLQDDGRTHQVRVVLGE